MTCLPLAPAAAQEAPAASEKAPGAKELPWLATLAEGRAQAQRQRQPLLVRFGGASCPWCRKLEEEIRQPTVQQELARWALVDLDVEHAEKDAQALAVSAIPALRLLTPAGRLVASHDGYLPADRLVAWLREHHDAAAAAPSAELIAAGPPDVLAVQRVAGALKARDPVLREAAVRRLLPHPGPAAGPVAEAFAQGPLQARLTALELLREWKAPVEEMDPWRPETLTEARLKALREWAPRAAAAPAEAAHALTNAERAAARADMARLGRATDEEATALRERLARHGRALLPDVYAQLKDATTDQARERLTALRYRLVASDALVLTWPGGLERLALTAAGPRQQAVQELATRAGAADEPLLLELFSNPDPLVRELSLRALKEVAGPRATPALTRLLTDPEPNVRAAVLKQLAEQPAPALAARIIEYAHGEKDNDLVVHAVRALKAAGGPVAKEGLKGLLKHESWQVRAEAAEGLAKSIDRYNRQNQAEIVDICVALVQLLEDPDGFVVSRAIPALGAADLATAVEPLVRAAGKHPELAAEIVRTLSHSSNMGPAALPHLRTFCGHAEAQVRAAAVGGLSRLVLLGGAARQKKITAEDVHQELRRALRDPAGSVRQAAGEALFEVLEHLRHAALPDEGGAILGDVEAAVAAIRSNAGVSSAALAVEKTEAWLAKFAAGKGRPAWLNEVMPLLEANLTSGTSEERLTAALPLIALGREPQALPILLAAAGPESGLQGKASAALPWLPWPKRLDLFNRLLATRPEPEQLDALASHLAEIRDKRAIARLWDVVATAREESAGALHRALERLYFGNAIYNRKNNVLNVSAADQKEAAAAARPRAEAGPDVQRLVALALLLPADPGGVADVARKVMGDTKASPDLRRDAFHVLLLSQPQAAARQAAAGALAHPEPGIRELAITVLARGMNVAPALRDHQVYVNVYDASNSAGIHHWAPQVGFQRVFIPDNARGLKPEQLRPLLRDANPKTAGHAGYLLALLQEPAGLDTLLQLWQSKKGGDDEWTELVFGAIAALNDDSKVPLLEEIYRGFLRNEQAYRVSNFYWTIRVLDGPNALRLRKMIRDEVGMAALR
jgi:HEAT repeat protein